MNLDKQLAAVKSDSDRCLRCATAMEVKFKDWLELVCELHQVTLAKEEKTAIDEQTNNATLAGVELKAELMKTSVDNAAEAAKIMKDNMKATRKVFEKAADKIPSRELLFLWFQIFMLSNPTAMEQVGMELVSSLAQTVTTTISQGLPALLLGSRGGRSATSDGDDEDEDDRPRRKRGKKSKTLQKDLNVSGSDDPAYKTAGLAKVPVNLLATLLGIGSDKGIDWEHLSPKLEEGEKSKEGLTFIEALISHAHTSTQWSDGEPSKRLKVALEDVLEVRFGGPQFSCKVLTLQKVISALTEEVAKDRSMAEDKVESESDEVKSWKRAVEKAQATILDLCTVASSFAGSAPGSVSALQLKPLRPCANSLTLT